MRRSNVCRGNWLILRFSLKSLFPTFRSFSFVCATLTAPMFPNNQADSGLSPPLIPELFTRGFTGMAWLFPGRRKGNLQGKGVNAAIGFLDRHDTTLFQKID